MAARDQAVQPAQQVITRDDADRELAAELEPPRHLGERHGTRARIHAPRVGRDSYAALDHGREDPLHLRYEVGRVAARGIAVFLFLQDGHRDFGEIVHHEVIDRSAAHLAVRRFQPVSPKPLPSRDSDGRRTGRHFTPPAPRDCGTTTERRAETEPVDVVTRVSMSGPYPSGMSSDGAFGNRITLRPPATTESAVASPTGASGPTNRTRAVPRQACVGRRANAG